MLRSKSICNEISVFFHSYFLFSKLWIICKRPKVNMSWYKELWDKSKYINIDIHVFQMKTAHIESDANRKSRRWYAGIPMDEDRNMNTRIVQRRRCCASISMDIFAILYVVTTQRCKRCAFDSPGLARNEPTPGKR